MTEIVDPDSGQFRGCEDVLECPRTLRSSSGVPNSACEDQSRVLPPPASRQPFLELTGAMAFQHPCGHFRQRNRPATPLTLRFHELQFPTHPLERLGDTKLATFDIYVLPPEAQSLAESQSNRQGN